MTTIPLSDIFLYDKPHVKGYDIIQNKHSFMTNPM